MKKKVLIMTCVLAAAGVVAQSHSFRDTSYVPYFQFDYDAWVNADYINHGKVYGSPKYPGVSKCPLCADIILQYNYTDNPAGTRVVGLSATISMTKRDLNPNATPQSLFLYEVSPDTFELKAQVQWVETDTAGRPTAHELINPNLPNCNHTGYDCRQYISPNNPYYMWKVFDYYFDKPITVFDSFYVGGTDLSYLGLYTHETVNYSTCCYYITYRPSQSSYDTACHFFPTLWKMYHYGNGTGGPQYQWHWKPSNQFMMVLPIIEVVDTSFANAPECPAVSGLFARGNYTDTVTVQWDYDSLHPEYQLWYGPENDFEARNAMVPLRTNRWVFSDASYADTQMVAYVRAVCHEYDTLRYSEWGRPIRFMLHHEEQDTTGHGDIGVPEAEDDLSRYVQLMPNPASGSVLINSSYGIDRVEAYDVRGEKVHDQPSDARTAAFDVSAWPKGAYVVLVRTPVGTAAKRLVVQ
ncbi:MAG: T9SS type A sorting domain-containing protein [Bacteroidales bacterium]|nr:T9SS type A sorting domain-containing protein [Bacteroidales bacterium]